MTNFRTPFAALGIVALSSVLLLGFRSGPDDGMWVGVTHTQYSADPWGDPIATGRARSILASSFPIQNQHIMGWGALNPEPSPGVYDFASLDRRVQLMRDTGARMVITLCCSPDWMKGGAPGTTDWNRLEDAPLPEHFGDFARLAATIAARYPDVDEFMVWNELKGFFDQSTNEWNVAAYTEMYNEVYTALKQVDSSIKVGGPYITMNSWAHPSSMSHPSDLMGPWGNVDQRSLDVIDYWLANSVGADFLVVDGGLTNRGATDVPDTSQAAKFEAINAWIADRTSLPIWWAEMHVGRVENAPADVTVDLVRASLAAMARSGASVVLLWQPQGTAGRCRACMWTDTATVVGGEPTETYRALAEALTRQPVSASDFEDSG